MIYSIQILILGLMPPLLLAAVARAESKVPLAAPMKVVAWTFFVGFSLKSLWLAWAVSTGLPFPTDSFTASRLYLGQLLVILGTLCMILGYLLLRRRRIRVTFLRFRVTPAVAAIPYWLLFAVALSAIAALVVLKGLHLQLASGRLVAAKFFVSESGIESSLGFLLIGADVLVVYFLYYIALVGRPLKPNVYLPVIVSIALVYFLSSQRMGVLIIIIGSLLVAKRSLLDLRSASSLKKILIFVLVLSLLSLAGYVRSERRDVSISELSVTKGIEATVNHAFSGLYAIDPAKLTGIVIKNDAYLYGRSFLNVLVAPVPRVMWADKPDVRIGPYVLQEVLGSKTKSGAPPSAFGEFYINFGWIGVVVGSLLIGCVLAIIRSINLHGSHPGLSRVRNALMLMVVIFFLIGDFSYAVLYALKYGIAMVVCEAYWRARLRRQMMAALHRQVPQNGISEGFGPKPFSMRPAHF